MKDKHLCLLLHDQDNLPRSIHTNPKFVEIGLSKENDAQRMHIASHMAMGSSKCHMTSLSPGNLTHHKTLQNRYACDSK
jgi:hypothetical protein